MQGILQQQHDLSQDVQHCKLLKYQYLLIPQLETDYINAY